MSRSASCVAQVRVNPSGVFATTRTPEVPLSRRCTMPGRKGSQSPSSLSACISGIERQESRHQGARALAGAGVHHLAGAPC